MFEETHSIKDVHVGPKYHVIVTFDNNVTKDVDLKPLMKGPIFKPLQSLDYFSQVSINHDIGTVVWPNGADLCPDVLYEEGVRVNPKTPRSKPKSGR